MDLDPSDKYSRGSSRESAKNNRLSRQSTVSHSSSHTSGIEADSHHRMSEEMSVDDPFGLEVVHLNKNSYSSTISQSTSGIEHESKGRTDGDSQDDGNNCFLISNSKSQVGFCDDIQNVCYREFSQMVAVWQVGT